MPDPWYDPTLDPVYVSGGDPNQYPTYGRSGGGSIYGEAPPWWAVLGPGIIAGSSATLSNIFRKYPEQPTYNAARPYYSTTGGYPVGGGSPTSGPGQLGDWIAKNWWVLLIGGLILFFPGVQRRRNPAARSSRRRNPRRGRRARSRRR